MFNKLENIGKIFKQEIVIYRMVLKDKRTPKIAKILIGLAIVYALLPFDLIPDFIPIIGQIDDIIIIPTLIFIALKIIPKQIIVECRIKVKNKNNREIKL